MGNWNKLMYTRIAWHESWLIWIKQFVYYQMLKNCVKNDFFKKFATNMLEGNRSIIIQYLLVSFVINRNNIGLLPCCWEVTGFQTIPKYYWGGFRDRIRTHLSIRIDSPLWPCALYGFKATIKFEINCSSKYLVHFKAYFHIFSIFRTGCLIIFKNPISHQISSP